MLKSYIFLNNTNPIITFCQKSKLTNSHKVYLRTPFKHFVGEVLYINFSKFGFFKFRNKSVRFSFEFMHNCYLNEF